MRAATVQFTIGAALFLGAAAIAQESPALTDELQPLQLRPIDMRVQDVGVLSNSFRIVQPGLDVPGDFSQVYQLPGATGRYSRIQGGLYAIFPESSYVQTEDGDYPLIPAGTVFYIGEPPEDVMNPQPTKPATLPPGSEHFRWNTRVLLQPAHLNRNVEDGVTVQDVVDAAQAQRGGASITEPSAQTSPPPPVRRSIPFQVSERDNKDEQTSPAIASDATYRAERLQELMHRAANAESQRNLP